MPIRVLYVDDNPSRQQIRTQYLSDDNRIEIETESDADTALTRVSEEEFDCVLSECPLAGWTGIEFLEAVQDRSPELPFVLFASEVSEAKFDRALAAGVTEIVPTSVLVSYRHLGNQIVTAVESSLNPHTRPSDSTQHRSRINHTVNPD